MTAKGIDAQMDNLKHDQSGPIYSTGRHRHCYTTGMTNLAKYKTSQGSSDALRGYNIRFLWP